MHCNSLTFPCTVSHLGCLGNVEFKATILASDKSDTFGFRHGKGLGLCIIFYGRRILTKNLQKSFFFHSRWTHFHYSIHFLPKTLLIGQCWRKKKQNSNARFFFSLSERILTNGNVNSLPRSLNCRELWCSSPI